jgi:chromosome segregation ATPase
MEGFSEGVKALADHDNGPFSPDEFLGLVSQLVEVEAGYERALAAAWENVWSGSSHGILKLLSKVWIFCTPKPKAAPDSFLPTAQLRHFGCSGTPSVDRKNKRAIETLSVVEALLAGVYSADTLDEARKRGTAAGGVTAL